MHKPYSLNPKRLFAQHTANFSKGWSTKTHSGYHHKQSEKRTKPQVQIGASRYFQLELADVVQEKGIGVTHNAAYLRNDVRATGWNKKKKKRKGRQKRTEQRKETMEEISESKKTYMRAGTKLATMSNILLGVVMRWHYQQAQGTQFGRK